MISNNLNRALNSALKNDLKPAKFLIKSCVLVCSILFLILCQSEFTFASDEAKLADAALRDVFFTDQNHGWTVGERGIILATQDGGQHWQRQSSGVTCSLNGVWFADEKNGWAVGGGTEPYSKRSRGVILKTENGGQTWMSLRAFIAPTLNGVKFFGKTHGVVFGRGEAAFPTGVWFTKDGGKNWAPSPATSQGSWTCGDFFDPLNGLLGGRNGRVIGVQRKTLRPGNRVEVGKRTIHGMLVQPSGTGQIVGDDGLFLTTQDAGRTWQFPVSPLPKIVRSFNFQSIAKHKNNIWIAGNPGTRIFHSPDSGKTWSAQSTGVRSPICKITFSDALHGCAVGELGTILITKDGGKTWKQTRAGGSRAAMLVLVAEPKDIPFETLVRYANADGYLATVAAIHNVDTISQLNHKNEYFHEAVIEIGGTATDLPWMFSVPQKELRGTPQNSWEEIDRRLDGTAGERLQEYLVRLIRTWRPEIIITDEPNSSSNELGPFVAEHLQKAIQAAGDPTQYIELTTEAGLDPWKTKKVLGIVQQGKAGAYGVDSEYFDARLGNSLSAIAAKPKSLLVHTTNENPTKQQYRVLTTSQAVNHVQKAHSFFAGLPLTPGGGARRTSRTMLLGNVAQLRKMANKRRNVRALIKRGANNPAWSAQMNDLVNGLDSTSGAEILFQMANKYRTEGQLHLATRTYEQLAQRYPSEPVTEVALHWLLTYYASGEMSLRVADKTATNSRASNKTRSNNRLHVGSNVRPAGGFTLPNAQQAVDDSKAVEQASHTQTKDSRSERAVTIGRYFEKTNPLAAFEPSVRLPIAVAQRKRGLTKETDRILLSLQQKHPGTAWWAIAQTERWLADPKNTPPPKEIFTCHITSTRPNLDGKLNDPIWNSTRSVQLANRWTPFVKQNGPLKAATAAISKQPNVLVSTKDSADASVKMIRDSQFLYVAITCKKASGVPYPARTKARTHDEDLSSADRVTLFLDVDRDFTTAWELTVDSSGRTHDACWGDATWNPTWYVAQSEDAKTWRIEAAIPLSELTNEPIQSKHVWAIGLRRVIPNQRVESWSSPASKSADPKHFGLLIFK